NYQKGSETNTAYFMNALLGRYTSTPGIYKCPSDKYKIPPATTEYCRSVSMNIWMADPTALPAVIAGTPAKRPYFRLGELSKTSQLFDLTHEDPNTIDDCTFRLDTTPQPWTVIENAPAALHNSGSCISFVDGHVEVHRWNKIQITNGVPIAATAAN